MLLYVPESYVLRRRKGKGISLDGIVRFIYSQNSHAWTLLSLVDKLQKSPAECMTLKLYFPKWRLQLAAFDHPSSSKGPR